MKSHLAASMCRIEQTVPSRTVEAESDNVLNTRSPCRSMSWILPSELETPNRPTSSGLLSPAGVPVQLGPSPMTREYSATPPGHIPPAQWGEFYSRAGDDGCELFGAVPDDDHSEELCPQPTVHQPDELHNVQFPVAPLHQEPLIAARCVNGTIVRPSNAEEDQPSTACRQSEVCAPGGVPLGRGDPGQNPSPGGRRAEILSLHRRHHHPHLFRMQVQLQVQQHIHCSRHRCTLSPKQQEEETHHGVPRIKVVAALINGVIKVVIRQEEALHQEEPMGQEEQDHLHLHPRQEEDLEQVAHQEELHPSRQEEEQAIQGLHLLHLLHLQALHNLYVHQIHGVH